MFLSNLAVPVQDSHKRVSYEKKSVYCNLGQTSSNSPLLRSSVKLV